MIGSYSADEEPTHWIDEWAAEIKAIRDKWTVSGMYRNDGSTTPLWTVDWYAYEVDVPNGGEHVVRYRTPGLAPARARPRLLPPRRVAPGYEQSTS